MVEAAFNQEKALAGAFSVITNLRMELFGALRYTHTQACWPLTYRQEVRVHQIHEAEEGPRLGHFPLRPPERLALLLVASLRHQLLHGVRHLTGKCCKYLIQYDPNKIATART